MKYFICLIFFLLVTSWHSFGQPNINWQSSLGGTGTEYISSSCLTFDNGCVFAGTSYSGISGNKSDSCRGNGDYWIIKLDSLGNYEWDHTFGGIGNDACNSIIATSDHGFILGGSSDSDSSGEKLSDSRGYNDFWILKLDSLGNIQWQKTIGGNRQDELSTVYSTIDRGYILGGYSASNISGEKSENTIGIGDDDYWIVKIDSVGNIQWQNTIGGSETDELTDIIQLHDGNYAVTGLSTSGISGDKTTNTHQFSIDYWILKIDQTGNIIWQKNIGGDGLDESFAVIESYDYSIWIGGGSTSDISGEKNENNRGFTDYWILRLDSSGNLQWQKTIGGSGDDLFHSMMQTDNGKILIGGQSESNISGDKTENSRGFYDFWLIGLSNTGNVEWQKTIGGDGDDELKTITKANNQTEVFAGTSLSGISGDKTVPQIGSSDYWILNTSILTNTSEIDSKQYFKTYPNPFSDIINLVCLSNLEFNVKINSFDGKEVYSTNSSVILSGKLDLSFLNPGVYTITLINKEINSTNSLIKIDY